MKVKMLTGLSGPDHSLAPGDTHECETAEAVRLVEAGFAVPVDGEEMERAVKDSPAETRGAANGAAKGVAKKAKRGAAG